MLQMVTAHFYDYSRIGLSIFEAIGLEWDEMAQWARGLQGEIFPQTCTWSIAIWEERFGITPDDRLSLETRRKNLMMKEQYRAPINPEAIRRVVAILSGSEDVEVHDFIAPYTFEIVVNHTENLQNMTDIWWYIYKMKPSHLSFRLYFNLISTVEHTLHSGLHYGRWMHTTILEQVEITEKDAWLEKMGE